MSQIADELPATSPVLERQNGYYVAPKIAVCVLCRTEVEIYIGCICKSCFVNKVLPLKKTTLKRKYNDRDPNTDW